MHPFAHEARLAGPFAICGRAGLSARVAATRHKRGERWRAGSASQPPVLGPRQLWTVYNSPRTSTTDDSSLISAIAC